MYKIQKDIFKFSYLNIDDLRSKRVLIRSCLNAVVDKKGTVLDLTRIDEAIKGIDYFIKNAKQVIILGHLGRPDGYSQEFSFWNIAEILEKKLDTNIEFVEDINVSKMKSHVILIDNIRFFKEEDSKDAAQRVSFAKKLAELGDIFINDSFPDYRESVSTYDIADYLPSFIGPAFLKEVVELTKLNHPEKPFVSILGGAKLSEKLDALKSLCDISDKVLIGGAMAYTLLKAKDIDIGKSLFEEDKLDIAKEILHNYPNKILLPIDHIVCDQFTQESANTTSIATNTQSITPNKIAIDIGPLTIKNYSDEIKKAKTVLWNGPMGVFEWESSEKGTIDIGKAVESNTTAYKVAGGGDSIAAINKFKIKGFNHVSTGGGAMLAFIAYNSFPTLDVILNKQN